MPKHKGDVLYSAAAGNPEDVSVAYRFERAHTLHLPESFFRDAIAKEPELVIGPCRNAGFVDEDEEWRCWKIEHSVRDIGSIDVLLLSSNGRICIVETKLASNPERRREVLAQVLDYATHLPRTGMAGLPSVPEDFADPEEVERHLIERDYLLIIAGDELEDRMASLSNVLQGRHLIHPWNLVLIDLCPYRIAESVSRPELLIVPALRKAVIKESRNVVSIETKKAQYKDDRVTVNVSFNIEEADVAPTAGQTVREVLTEEEFWANLRKVSPAASDRAGQIVSFAESVGLVKRFGVGSLIFDLPPTGDVPLVQQVFFIRRTGKVVVWPETLRRQCDRNGLQVDLSAYRSAVIDAFHAAADQTEPSCSLDQLDVEAFKKAVADFVSECRSAPLKKH